MIETKKFYLNDMSTYTRGELTYTDLGYSLDIPANDVVTAGWISQKPETWGKEGLLITRSDPEYYAPDNLIRSNVLPSVNIHDKIYSFDRSKYTYKIY